MCSSYLHQIAGYKSQCLVELETLEEQEAVYEYWYTQVEYNIHTFSNHLKNVPSYPYMSCLLDPYHNSEIQSIDI